MNIHPAATVVSGACLVVALASCAMGTKNEAPPPAPPPAAAAPPPPPPAPAPEPETFAIEDVLFDFDKASLRPEAKGTLDEVVTALKAQPDVSYEVAGHTDSIGTNEYNQGLGERRANSVYEYLVGEGVSASQISTRSYGEENPVAPNQNSDGSDNPEGRQQNRRGEVAPRP
jgi:OOP family OmpA-OmpF porin